MKYDVILNQFNEHNEIGIILAKKYNISTSIIIIKDDEREKYNELKKVYEEIIPSCNIKGIIIDKGDNKKISELVSEYIKSNLLINLTGGERINALLLLKEGSYYNSDCIYVDLLNMKSYLFSKDINILEENFEDLKIDEITKLSGANIINDSNYLVDKEDISFVINGILNHLDLWEEYKKKLYDNNIFIHNYKDQSVVVVNKAELDDNDLKLLYTVLKYIKGIGSISYHESKDRIEVNFNNNYLKGFIFKSGTWLEVLTNKVVEEIREIDEVKSGVEFFWSNDAKMVKNELDVVAIKDSVLVCISCKDSEKYDEDALNELEVYSKKIGGDNVIKILVATKKPIKKTIIDRAKEMNINLIILDKDINKFKHTLIEAINKK